MELHLIILKTYFHASAFLDDTDNIEDVASYTYFVVINIYYVSTLYFFTFSHPDSACVWSST